MHYIEQIRELGGVLECIRNGFFQREIAEASYRFQQEVEANERVIVGVNDYVMSDETVKVPTLYVDPAKERIHLERLERVRRERDNERCGGVGGAGAGGAWHGEHDAPSARLRARLLHAGRDDGRLPHRFWRLHRGGGVLRPDPRCRRRDG